MFTLKGRGWAFLKVCDGRTQKKSKIWVECSKPKLCEVTRVSVLIFYYFPYLHIKVMFTLKIFIF